MQLVFSALSNVQGNIELLPPAIIKPMPLWSGKQVISTVIMNITPRGQAQINLIGSAKIRPKEWQIRKPRRWKSGGTEFDNFTIMSEAEVVIRNGELLCGVLDKSHYGATPYGLIHCIFEVHSSTSVLRVHSFNLTVLISYTNAYQFFCQLYGGTCSSKMLSAFGKLFQTFLQIDGFTLGIEDILILPNADVKRTNIIRRCRMVCTNFYYKIL